MKNVDNFITKRRIFGLIMVCSTITLSLSAAYYSVSGLSSLFAGAKIEVMIMASSLELAKLIVAAYLHNNWNNLGILLKGYLTIGVIVLMLITSAGIYGFLTSAYQVTADQLTIIDKQTAVVELKKNRYQESLDDYQLEKAQLNQSISDLSNGLSNNTIQYKDNATGVIITTTSSSTRIALQAQLNETKEQRLIVSTKMESLTDSITKLDLQVLGMEVNNELATEIGPLRYLSKITGKSMDVIVNWLTLLIIFVFDPLAVAMVIAISKYISAEEPKNDDSDTDHALDMVLNNMVDSMTEDEMTELTDKTKLEPTIIDKKTLYGEVHPSINNGRRGDSLNAQMNIGK
jgi:hypothetical protein